MPKVEDARTVRTRRQALAVFFSYPSPRVLALLLAATIGARLRMAAGGGAGALGWVDLALAVALMAVLWPVQEWFLHQYVLHLRPRELGGRRFDPFFARKHRAHHRSPHYLPDVFLPLRVVLPLAPLMVLTWTWLLPSPGLAVTAMAAYSASALAYEWIHYLTHTSVQPESGWFRRVRRNHRYHHYKNERYWHGFTLPIVDTLFGTNPSPSEVETSKTARNLGVDDQGDDEGSSETAA